MTSLPRLYVPDDKVTSPSVKNIIEAVERLSTEPRLVADGSRDSTLPTVVGKHKDLTAISAATVWAGLRFYWYLLKTNRLRYLLTIDM
ncbi:hypothetical protein DPMN_097524 [Dreissena polymorpha]|uniref:Uncharacterized protein n=1 Tax=Dreissena polymorpha TaxID=45954 RepID=A0A9D4LBE3_DREPO|nr:hypothetical protein DPMN_097524 [Dreissena polymorpha]